jgi:hypothetical protein
MRFSPTSRCWESYSGIEDYGQKAAIKKGRAISDPASDSSASPPVDYSEYLLMKDQFQPAGFNPSKYDFGDQFLFSNSGFLVQGGK